MLLAGPAVAHTDLHRPGVDERAGALAVLDLECEVNAVKHAPDASVQVRIARTGPDLLLEVTDNGPGGAAPDGSGLHGVAERATALGGTFLLTSPAGAGTKAVARLPVGQDFQR
jgi:glucose-6-phosphate-specific signal transduction histidine kinase